MSACRYRGQPGGRAVSTGRTYATYGEARAATDAEYRDAAAQMAAHARVIAKRLSDGIAATHPGYYFEYDETPIGDQGASA